MSEKIRYQDVKLETKTVTGFVVNGRFYGDNEELARYELCTHRPCMKCGEDAPKCYTMCESCIEKTAVERWESSEKLPADQGEEFFYSDYLSEYFSSIDEAGESADEHGLSLEQLRLYHCAREKPPEVDLYDVYEDITPEDFDPSDMYSTEIEAACEALNALIRQHPVNCFNPSKIGVLIDSAD